MGGARTRILGMLAVLVIVAGCSSNKDQSTMAGDGSLTGGDRTAVTNTDTGLSSTTTTGNVTPGTQEDLTVNVGDRVFYGYDQSDLSAEARATVEKQAQWLKTYPNVNVTVEGHCDERGTREYNLALGEKRAMAVKNYLISNGVEPGRIQTISYGKERPAVTGSDEASWAQNRRGVLVVQ